MTWTVHEDEYRGIGSEVEELVGSVFIKDNSPLKFHQPQKDLLPQNFVELFSLSEKNSEELHQQKNEMFERQLPRPPPPLPLSLASFSNQQHREQRRQQQEKIEEREMHEHSMLLFHNHNLEEQQQELFKHVQEEQQQQQKQQQQQQQQEQPPQEQHRYFEQNALYNQEEVQEKINAHLNTKLPAKGPDEMWRHKMPHVMPSNLFALPNRLQTPEMFSPCEENDTSKQLFWPGIHSPVNSPTHDYSLPQHSMQRFTSISASSPYKFSENGLPERISAQQSSKYHDFCSSPIYHNEIVTQTSSSSPWNIPLSSTSNTNNSHIQRSSLRRTPHSFSCPVMQFDRSLASASASALASTSTAATATTGVTAGTGRGAVHSDSLSLYHSITPPGLTQDAMIAPLNPSSSSVSTQELMSCDWLTNATGARSQLTSPAVITIDNLRGKVYETAKDQHGCRFLQRWLEAHNHSKESLQLVLSEILPNIQELMSDQYANFLIQKLFDVMPTDMRHCVARSAAPHIARIALTPHGTFSIQKMIETMTTKEEMIIVRDALHDSVAQLIRDVHGNHVIQKVLQRFDYIDKAFIYDAVAQDCVSTAKNKQGCCVLQRCLEYASANQKTALVQHILTCCLEIVQDPYGNYVLQYILKEHDSKINDVIALTFLPHLVHLCINKFSSNVMEKVLCGASLPIQEMYVETMCTPDIALRLIQDDYGNYVLQTALSISSAAHAEALAIAIRPFMPLIKNAPYAKKFEAKMEAICRRNSSIWRSTFLPSTSNEPSVEPKMSTITPFPSFDYTNAHLSQESEANAWQMSENYNSPIPLSRVYESIFRER